MLREDNSPNLISAKALAAWSSQNNSRADRLYSSLAQKQQNGNEAKEARNPVPMTTILRSRITKARLSFMSPASPERCIAHVCIAEVTDGRILAILHLSL